MLMSLLCPVGTWLYKDKHNHKTFSQSANINAYADHAVTEHSSNRSEWPKIMLMLQPSPLACNIYACLYAYACVTRTGLNFFTKKLTKLEDTNVYCKCRE